MPADEHPEPAAGAGAAGPGGGGARYHFAYSAHSPYGHVVRLLAAHTHVPGGLVLDLGCGFGAIAEPVRDLGLAYVGLDLERSGLEDLAARGFDQAVLDLRDETSLRARLDEVVAGRPVAAITALDVVEHLTNGPAVLAALHDVAFAHGRPPLVVSIPNVTHLDLAAKLLVGRWDVTPTGLLDETHVALYSLQRLERTFTATGWAEVGEADFPLDPSDQHFPADAAPLAPTPLRAFLAELRGRAAPGTTTNQWVRAYAPVAVVPGARAVVEPHELVPAGPFLSIVLVPGDASEAELADVLVALDAQSVTGFELVAVAPGPAPADRRRLADALAPFAGGLAARSRVVPGPAPGDPRAAPGALGAGVRAATGRYVATLDGRSVVLANFVETFARLAEQHPGAVLRAQALLQPVHEVAWPGGRTGPEPTAGAARASLPRYSLLDHLAVPSSPPGSYALPRTCFTVLGLAYEDALDGLEHDEVLARAATYCGVAESTGEVVVLIRRQKRAAAESRAALEGRARLRERIDEGPVLLPAGSLAGLPSARPVAAGGGGGGDGPDASAGGGRALGGGALGAAEAELAAARRELAALRTSTSWRATAPLRWLSSAIGRRAGAPQRDGRPSGG